MKRPIQKIKSLEKKSSVYHKVSPFLLGAGILCEAAAIVLSVAFPPAMMYLVGTGCFLIGGKLFSDVREFQCDAKVGELKKVYSLDDETYEELSRDEATLLDDVKVETTKKSNVKKAIETEEETEEDVLVKRK